MKIRIQQAGTALALLMFASVASAGPIKSTKLPGPPAHANGIAKQIVITAKQDAKPNLGLLIASQVKSLNGSVAKIAATSKQSKALDKVKVAKSYKHKQYAKVIKTKYYKKHKKDKVPVPEPGSLALLGAGLLGLGLAGRRRRMA